MKKNIFSLSLLCGLLCLSACSEEDNGTLPPALGEEPAGVTTPTTLAWGETEKMAAVFYDGQDIPVNLQLLRSGNSSQESVTASVTVLSQAELDAYNATNATSYEVLPAEFYELPAEVELTATDRNKRVRLTVKNSVESAEGLKENNYVIPVRLSCNGCEVRSSAALAMVQVRTDIEVSASLIDLDKNTAPIELVRGLSNISLDDRLAVTLNMDNHWNFDLTFVEDETELSVLLAEYQTANPGNDALKLLPAGTYTIGAVAETPDEGEEKGEVPAVVAEGMENGVSFIEYEVTSRKPLSITVDLSNNAEIESGEYLLPVKLATCSMPFVINGEVQYLRFKVTSPTLSMKNAGETTTQAITVHAQDINEGKVSATEIKTALLLNVSYNWETEGEVTFESDEAALGGLVVAYNEKNSTNYTLLPSSTYQLSSVNYQNGEEGEKELVITVTPDKSITESATYLLPIKIKSIDNAAIGVAEDAVSYLVVKVTVEHWTKVDLTGCLSVAHETKSAWADLPISLLIDGNLYFRGANDWAEKGAGYWQSEWNFPNSTGCNSIDDYYDETYGVYFDIALSEKQLTDKIRVTVQASQGPKRPKKVKIYKSEDRKQWENWREYSAFLMDTADEDTSHKGELKDTKTYKSNFLGMINGEEKTVNIYQRIDEYANTSSIKYLRYSFYTNKFDKELSTQGNLIALDELIIEKYVEVAK